MDIITFQNHAWDVTKFDIQKLLHVLAEQGHSTKFQKSIEISQWGLLEEDLVHAQTDAHYDLKCWISAPCIYGWEFCNRVQVSQKK